MISQEELDHLTKSSEFQSLINEVDDTNPRFRAIPLAQKQIALAMLMTGRIDGVEELNHFYLKRPIPTIQEFLTFPYLGDTANTIYPQWRTDLSNVFSPQSTVLEWCLTGAIGTGKTTIAIIAHLYNLYRINCLRRPQLSMGSDPTKTMNLQLFTVTLGKAESILVGRVRTFLRTCQTYVEVRSQADFLDYRDEKYDYLTPWCEEGGFFVFPNNVRIASGSQSRHALGEDVFGGLLDEAEFRQGLAYGDIESTFELYYEILERIRSRFLGSRFVLMTILSSIKASKGVMATHLEDAKRKSTSKVSQYSIWDTKFPNAIKEGYFWVLRGTQRHPSRVLEEHDQIDAENGLYQIPAACELLKVPNIYREDFDKRTERSLQNLAGRISMGQEIPFDDLSQVEDHKLCPVLYINAPLQGNSPLRDQLPKDIFIRTPEGYRFKRYPGSWRYGHADLADTGEAGLAIFHKELSITGKIMYVSDLIMKINSPNRISLDAVRELIMDLKYFYGLSFEAFTADQYQSTQLLQKLQSILFCSDEKKIKVQSVDRNRIPYDTLASVVSEDALKTGMMRELKEQLENIYFDDFGRPTSQTGHKGDIADAVCGAIFNAVNNPIDLPVNVYEHYGRLEILIPQLEEQYERIT